MKCMRSLFAWMEKKVLSGNASWLNAYASFYRQTVRNEITLADITSKDKIVNVGCGSIPFTAMHLSQLTGAEVWAIDRDKEAIATAKALLNKINFKGKIHLMVADGQDPLPYDFNVAIVALQVEPKDQVIKNLFQYAAPDFRLIVREPRPFLKKMYDTASNMGAPKKKIYQGQLTFSHSLLFLNQNQKIMEF